MSRAAKSIKAAEIAELRGEASARRLRVARRPPWLMALRGFLVFAPTLRGFAERMEPPPLRDATEDVYASSCEAASYDALLSEAEVA